MKGAHEDGGGVEVGGNIWLEKAPWSSDSPVPGSFTLGQAGAIGARSFSSSWEGTLPHSDVNPTGLSLWIFLLDSSYCDQDMTISVAR